MHASGSSIFPNRRSVRRCSTHPRRMPLVPFFRQTPFRTIRQIIQRGFVVDAFDEFVERKIYAPQTKILEA